MTWLTTRPSRTNRRHRTAATTPTHNPATRRNCVIRMMHSRIPAAQRHRAWSAPRCSRRNHVRLPCRFAERRRLRSQLSSLTVRARLEQLGSDTDARGQGRSATCRARRRLGRDCNQSRVAQDRSRIEAVVATQLIVAPDGKVVPHPSAAVSMKITMLKFIWTFAAGLFQSGNSIQTHRVPAA